MELTDYPIEQEPCPFATIIVPCYHNATTTNHTVILYTDGTININQHIEEEWGYDDRVVELLGGGKDVNPCIWWGTPLTNPILHSYTWNFGIFHSEKNTNNQYEPLQWTFTFHSLPPGQRISYEAIETLFQHCGIIATEEGLKNNKYNYKNLTPELLEKIFTYYTLILPHLNEPLYYSILVSVIASVPVTELSVWLELNIPWRDIQGYVFHQVDPYLAHAIQEAVHYRIELHYLGTKMGTPHYTSGHPITKVGTPLYWLENLTQLGIPKNRIASFITRTAESGALQWRKQLCEEIIEELPPAVKKQIPHEWIIEAVASAPEDEILQTFSYNLETTPPPDWGTNWIYTILKQRILNNFSQHPMKDPAYWEPFWYLPTEPSLVYGTNRTITHPVRR